jgi:thiol-disulfide isomerase/thioredoxin
MLMCVSGMKAQLSVEPIVEMLRSRDGEECIYTNSEGKQLAIETVGEMVLKAAMSMKSATLKPWIVTNGVRKEVRIFDPLPITQKKNTDGIDFAASNLVFLREDKTKLSGEEAKKMLEADNTLLAEMYNGINGVASEYIIKPRPKPVALSVHANGTTKQLDENDPKAKEAMKRMGISGTTSADNAEGANFALASSSVLKTGATMPDFDAVDISGKRWKMGELRDKILVLNFWFVECPPCIDEMPALSALQKEYASNPDVVFLSFANSTKEKITKFLTAKTFTYPHVAQEQAAPMLKDWGVAGYPTNVVVNRGKILSSFTGGMMKQENTDATQHPMYTMINSNIKKCLAK